MKHIAAMSLEELSLLIGLLHDDQRAKVLAALSQNVWHNAEVITYRMDEARPDELPLLTDIYADLVAAGDMLDGATRILFRRANRGKEAVAA